jgi:hypothetical protein
MAKTVLSAPVNRTSVWLMWVLIHARVGFWLGVRFVRFVRFVRYGCAHHARSGAAHILGGSRTKTVHPLIFSVHVRGPPLIVSASGRSRFRRLRPWRNGQS